MRTFLINLARRSDRLMAMQAQLSRLGLPCQVVTAIDATRISDDQANKRFATNGPLGPLPKGDKCCTLSHMRAWQMFLETGDSRALILEDDVALDPDAVQLLQDLSWIAPAVGLVKVEHYGPDSQRVLVDELVEVGCGRQVGRLLSRHTGAAAYIISRQTAQILLAWPKRWTLPVDHMLFNPNNSPLAAALCPYQLTPAIARQTEEIGGSTDIDHWRAELRDGGWGHVRRELVRAYYELRLLPSQVASLLWRESEFVRVVARRSSRPVTDRRAKPAPALQQQDWRTG
jgi:glycosyl transferase family 25